MAEPRKPRVIRTRNPLTPTDGSAQDERGAAEGATATSAGTVRGTSEKVAVLKVPADGTKTPAAKPPTAKPPAAKPPAAKVGAKLAAKATSASKPSAKAATKSGLSRPGAPQSAPQDAAAPKPVGPRGGTGGGAEEETVAKVLAFPIPEYKRRRKAIWLSAAGVAAVLALVMGIAVYSPVLGVKTIDFDGNKLVSEESLQLALAPLMSRPLPQVRDSDVAALLEPVPQVKSSRIEARPPSTLIVHVVERVPVALLKNGKSFSLVDQDGVELATTKDAATAALPLIDGGKAAIGKDTFQAMTAVLATLPKSILAKMANATAKSPDAVELKLVDGRSVIWGNASDMELKAQVLEALLNAPPPTAEEGKPEPVPAQVFDVSAPRHPVTR